jgi:hypothetical protein
MYTISTNQLQQLPCNESNLLDCDSSRNTVLENFPAEITESEHLTGLLNLHDLKIESSTGCLQRLLHVLSEELK